MHSHCEPTDLGKLVENNWWSNILGGKPVDKQLAENAPAENSSQKQNLKYSANFNYVIKF